MATKTEERKKKFEETFDKLESKYGSKEETKKTTPSTSSNANSTTNTSSGISAKEKKQEQRQQNFDSTFARMESRYNKSASVNETYINTFLEDAQSFLKRASSTVNGLDWKSATSGERYNSWNEEYTAMKEKEEKIRSYLRENKDTIDSSTSKQITSLLDSFHWSSVDAKVAFNNAKKHYSQWETEEDYLKWKKDTEEYEALKNFDTEKGEAEVQDLEKVLNEYKALSRTMIDDRMQARLDYITANYGDEKGIKTLIAEKKQYINRAKHIQEGITLAGVIDNDDFKEKSGYTSTKSDDRWSKLTSDFGMGYDDLTYEYINGEESGMRQEIINKAVSWDADTDKFFVYDHMTDDQISTYNYYYAKDGKEAAEKYLNSIRETLNYQAATERYEKMEGKTALELLFGIEAGVNQFQSGMKNLFNTEDDYIAQTATQMLSGMVREDLADNGAKLPDWLGGASIAQAGYDAITTTANMVPSIMTSTVMNFVAPGSGAVVGSAMMGASAAGNAYQEMLNLGYDKSQARAYSTLVGASEAGLQYLLGGIGQLGGKLSGNALNGLLNGIDNAFLRTALQVGGNMLSEGFEEGLQEILTPWFQNLIMNTGENVNWSEVAYSTLLGALTAGVMEGPTTIAGEVKTYSTGKQLQAADISATRLAEIGKTFSADTVAYQLAGKVDENTGAYTMGRLFNEIGATLSEQNVTEITDALVAKGMDQITAKKNAQALAYVVEGGQLSDTQVAMIEGNEVLAEVARTTLIDANTTWNQRSKGYNDALMSLAQEKTSQANPAKQSQEKALAVDTVDAQNNEATQSLPEADTVDDSPAKVQTISSIGNGQVTVKMEDGTETNLKNADLSVDDGVRIETIAKMEGISATDANFILNTLRTNTSTTAQMDSLGAREVWKYGFYGFSQEHMATHGVFSNSLTESQRKAIYETARAARQKQVEAKQANVSKKEMVGDKKTSTGKVHFEGDHSKLTDRQSASLTAMEKVAEVLGVQIYVFESELNERGQRVGANGWYDTKDNSIHIDLYAGANGEGTMLFTLAHELTHHIRKWSPAKFKVLADFLMQEYGKNGVNVDALVREQMAKAKRNGRTISYDNAYEEVVADSMEIMLSDGNVVKRLEKLKAQDKDLWHKIKSFIDELAAKIKAVYKRMSPDSVEGQHVAEMGKAIYRLQELFTEGLVDASENFQSAMETVVEAEAKTVAEEEIITDGAVVTDGNGKKYSIRSMKQDIAEGQMFEDLKTYCGWTQKQVNELRNNLADLVEYMTPYRNILDMNETYGREGRRFSPYKPNSDPLYKISMDFSTLCSKRLLTQYVIENLQLRENRPMSAEEQMAIRDMLNEYRKVEKGLQVACAMCYVEAARLKSPKQITKWMEDPGTQMKNYFADKNPEFANFIKEKQADFKESRGYDRNATKKDMSPKDVRELNKIRPRLRSQYQLSAEEAEIVERAKSLPGSTYLTAGNLASLSETDPTIYAAYTAFVRTATRSKSLETDEPYYYGDSRRDNGNGIIVSDSFIESVNRENGMRFSSWSDWRIQHLLDYIAAVIDNSVRGAAMHGYTKFGEEVRVLGKTGMMFNMSGVAGTQTGLNEDGSLSFSPTESIDVNEAIQLREEFPDTAGLQCIGVGDDHIIALLRSDIIDYVIPYHVSGLNAGLRAMANIHGWKDYTSTQHAAIDKSIKFENAVDQEHWHEEPVYSEFFVGYDTGMTGIEAMRASADRYVQMCKDRGLKPKFEQFVNEDNYWKLLIDRKMVNQKTGKLIQQKPVTPTFDFDTVKSVVDQFVENYDSGLEARALNHIVENWDSIPKRIRDLKKQGSSKAKKASKAVDTLANQTLAAQPTVLQSARDEAIELSDVNTKFSLREEAPPKKTKIGYKAFFVKDGKLYPPMVANPSGAGTPVGVWLNADTGSPMRDGDGNIVQNKSGRAKVAAGGKGTKGGGGSLAWRPGWHLGPIPDATQFSVDPASKEWSEWLNKSGRTAGESKNIGNNGNPIFLNPHIVFAEVEFAADVDYQLEAYEYGVKKNGKFDHSQAGIPYVIKDGYYRYRTNSMAPGALSWYITGAMKVNRILTDAECREICAKSGRDMMPRLGGDFDFASHSLTAGEVTPTEDLSSVAPKQDFSDEVLKLPGYVRRKLDFSDPNFRKAFDDDSIADMLDYYEKLYNETDAKKFSYRDGTPNAFNPDGKTLDEQLDEILHTAESFDGRYLYIGRFTPAFIDMVKKYVDIKDLPIAMNYRDAYLSMESKDNGKYKGDGINYHNLGKEGMKSAIESFDRPEQVMLSKKDGKIELVLEGVDRKGNRLLSIVALNTSARNAQEFIEAHIVTSIYGKRSIERYVSKADSEGRLIYTKKEELAQGISQVQYEGNINANSSFETTIAQTGTDVKMLSDRIDTTGMDESATKIIRKLEMRAKFARYGETDYASYSADRMRLEISRSSATQMDYAKSYIAWVDPDDFLYATTSSQKGRDKIEEEAGTLDLDRLRKETQPIHLTVDFETGKIVGHEGRHRLTALRNAGIKKVAVIFDAWNDDRHNTKPVDMMKIYGREFDRYHIGTDFYVHDMLPLSRRYADAVTKLFSDVAGTIKFSDRDTESVSNRSLLANAFEGVAQNDMERQRLQEYKGKINLINAEERKLSELNEQIKELSFANGPKDTKAIRDLQFEAKQAANRISTYDRQLLRLEASKPLQDLLTREKNMAYKRAEKKGKEALEAYREKTMKTQRELIDKWQESRKKGIESRQRTAMRHKIKDVVNELNQYLLHGTKDRHVPIELQKAVAEALDAVNMDTVGAEERIAKLEAELLKAKTPEQIQEISRKIDHIREMGDRMSSRLKKLKLAYDEIINSDDPLIANSHDDGISAHMMKIIVRVGDTPLREMTVEQLEDVYDVYRMVLTTIRNANKAFKAKKSESISIIANKVMMEVEKAGGKKKLSRKGTEGIKSFIWNNLKPVYAFEHIGSESFTEVFNAVRSGEDVWAKNVTEAREFYLDKSKKHSYDSWDFKKRFTFTSTSGMEFSLDLEQIMSLYAYSKRDQAADHLKKGGIVIDETTEITVKNKLGIPVKFNPTEATAYNLSDATLAEIISKLTAEQKSFVDEMQDYLSTVMGNKGNEVSLEMYGVKLFKEKFYFPLKSAQQFMAKAKEQQKGEIKIKNSGFSKETVQKASNPIVLTPFMNVWADHVNEMSMYHAFVLPMEDFYRVYNYKTPTSETMATESVEMFIQNAYGKGATQYIDQLLKDLNGGARTDHTTGIINKMMGLFKKGAVFASLSVVVQQPSAIARAAALVDTKYFIGPKVDHKKHAALWDEVKQYAPVAVIKEMGYFDTNMGKSTQDFILAKEYSGFKDKMKALFTDSGFRDEALSKAPALADEIAWCGIWEAVKRETKAKNPGMDIKSEAFLKKVGERFTEVIVKTQVYDSVLSRSGLMRSKDTGMKMATAFMAEPTTSINMIADALLQGKRGNRKYARAAIGAVIASQILNSILVSFVYAGRDDDEDETYMEKYIGTLSGEILDSLNPAGYIPFIKDIMSIVQGYDVERSDMAVISDLWKAWENLSKDYISPYRKVEGFAGSIAQIFGLPVKNIMRDARGIYQTINSFVNGQQTTKAGIEYAVQGAITGKTVSNDQQLYEAILSGDQAQIARVKGRFDDQSAINSAIRKALRANDPRIHDAAIAWNANDLDEYMRIAKQIIAEKHFSQDDVVMAIRAEANKLAPSDGTSGTSSAKGLFTAEKFAEAIAQGDQATANAIKLDIIQTAKTNGKTEEEAEKSFASSAKGDLKELYLAGTLSESKATQALTAYCDETKEEAEQRVAEWKFEEKHGFKYDDKKEQFMEGKISASEMKNILMQVEGKTDEEANSSLVSYTRDAYEEGYFDRSTAASVMVTYGGLTEAEAESKLQYIDVKKQLPDTYVDDAWVAEYYKEVESSGISIEVFVDYRNQVKGITGEGKKERRMAVINSMPISNAQKDALYYAEGWAASRLYEAPWR